jgi:CheY-like chemotaxis protein
MACKLIGAGLEFCGPATSSEHLSSEKPFWQFTTPTRSGRLGTVLVANNDKDEASLLSYALKAACIKNPIRWLNSTEEVIHFLVHGGAGKGSDSAGVPEMPLLLFIDWDIHWSGALDLLKWIRQQPKYLSLLVVVMTGANDPDCKRAAYEAGTNWHFVKSADFIDLMRLVRRLREFWSYAVEPGFYEQLAAR